MTEQQAQQPPGPPVPPFVPGHLGAPTQATMAAVSATIGALATIERCGDLDVFAGVEVVELQAVAPAARAGSTP